jgi:Bacterial aa3 type cytochrome c oxidase subunit IV
LIAASAWSKTFSIQHQKGFTAMAHSQEHDHASAMDYPAHEETYHGFVHLVTWGTCFVIAIVVGMAIFLV